MYLVQSDEDQQGQAMMDLQTMPSLITPGTILFAVLKNTVNSDQPRTPVMARIIAGPYKDATVLGNFTREDDRLVVRFTQLIPKGSAMPIYLNAYAIDPNTSETSVASDADHHYFSRYASLFAASFLQGFGQLFSQNNTEVVCNDGDVCTYTPVELSTRRGVYAGLGQVGEAISGEIRKNFNRAPTVTLERGTGVGVLVMSASYRSNSDEQKPFSEKNHEQTKQDER
ncbi:MAG: DotG/IcmE/VirB10 family protein [Candidatus Puniceispirillaceae bacterium]